MEKEKDSASIGIEGYVETNGGHIAGRDVFNIVLNTIQEKLPKLDPLPKEMENALNSLEILIDTLKAWKEVHNALDEIRSKFDQYKHPMDSANYRKQLITHKRVKLYWRPVKSKVEHFENRIEEAMTVEKDFSLRKTEFDKQNKYKDREDDVVECRKKSFVLINISNDLEDAINSTSLTPNYEYLLQSIKLKIGLEYHWWHNLSSLTDELDNNITEAMYLSDKLLRDSADRLFNFSQTYLIIKGK